MNNKLVEAITKILEGLNRKNISLEEVNSQISKTKHFDKQTLSIAYSLIYDKALSGKTEAGNKKQALLKNFRIFSNEERDALGSENVNYLMHLYNVGLLNEDSLEYLMEQVMMFPTEEITKEEINWIILFSLVEFNSEALPGSRFLLYSSDTIN